MPATDQTDEYRCPSCRKLLKSRRALTMHRRVAHEGAPIGGKTPQRGSARRSGGKTTYPGGALPPASLDPVPVARPRFVDPQADESAEKSSVGLSAPEQEEEDDQPTAEADSDGLPPPDPDYGKGLGFWLFFSAAPGYDLDSFHAVEVTRGYRKGFYLLRDDDLGLVASVRPGSYLGDLFTDLEATGAFPLSWEDYVEKVEEVRSEGARDAGVLTRRLQDIKAEFPVLEEGELVHFGGKHYSVKNGKLVHEMFPPSGKKARELEGGSCFVLGPATYVVRRGHAEEVLDGDLLDRELMLEEDAAEDAEKAEAEKSESAEESEPTSTPGDSPEED